MKLEIEENAIEDTPPCIYPRFFVRVRGLCVILVCSLLRQKPTFSSSLSVFALWCRDIVGYQLVVHMNVKKITLLV